MSLITKLDALSPLKTLTRGYCIVEHEDDKIIKSADDLKTDETIKMKFYDGTKMAKVI